MKRKMSCPQELLLKESVAQPGKLGVWCQSQIKCGKQYGPFLGQKVSKPPLRVEPCEVWKVIKDNGNTLHYVDGSKCDSWMRHIKCAPSAIENNVAFFQENFRIYYRIVKDVAVGEELLIWLDETDKVNGKATKAAKSKEQRKKNSSKEKCPNPPAVPSVEEDASANDLAPVDLLVKEVVGTKIHISTNSSAKTDSVKDDTDSEEDLPLADISCEIKNDTKVVVPPKRFEYQFQLTKVHIIKGRQGQKQYKCDVCVGMYRHGFSLKRHFIRNHVNYNYLSEADIANCNINTNVINNNRLLSKFTVKEQGDPKLGKKKSKDNSENSLPSDVFRCHLCNCHFSEKAVLKAHIANHPDTSTQKRFPCTQCEMTFSHKQNLVRHLSVHSGIKPYCCKYCNKCFPTIANQKRHERIHEGLKPYSCNHCTSSFTQSGDLRKHIKKQHPRHYYPCSACPKYFGTNSNLRDHISQAHLDVSDYSSSVTATPESSPVKERKGNVHARQLAESSAEDLKHSCSVCNKRFQSYVNMCRHRRHAHQEFQGKRAKPSNGTSTSRNLRNDGNGKTIERTLDPPETEFYMTVAQKISDNLLNYLDGKIFQFSKAHRIESLNDKDHRLDLRNVQWQTYNFPPDFDISALERLDVVTQSYLTNKDFLYDCSSTMSECTIDGIMSSTYSNFDSESDTSSMSDYTDIRSDDENFGLIGRNMPITYICSVCMERFSSEISIEEHKINNHTNVFCTHIEIEGDKDVPPELCLQYCSPVGALRQCSVPPLTEMSNSYLTCTKCGSSFDSVSSLHMHILECGGDADFKKQQHFASRYSRKRGRPMRRHHLWISEGIVHNDEKCKKLEPSPCPLQEENVKESSAMGNTKAYVCKGCLKNFVYLSAFERHQRTCHAQSEAKKASTKSPLKASGKCQSCPYCKRVFIYITSLRKHIKEGCPKKPVSPSKVMPDSENSTSELEKTNKETVLKSLGFVIKEEPAQQSDKISTKLSIVPRFNPPPLLSRQMIKPKPIQPLPQSSTMSTSQSTPLTFVGEPKTFKVSQSLCLPVFFQPLPIPVPAGTAPQPVHFLPLQKNTLPSSTGNGAVKSVLVLPVSTSAAPVSQQSSVSPLPVVTSSNASTSSSLPTVAVNLATPERPTLFIVPNSDLKQSQSNDDNANIDIELPECIKTEVEDLVLKGTEEKDPLDPRKVDDHSEEKMEIKGTTLYQQLHSCPYCLRKFCYLANYRRHIKDICIVKKNLKVAPNEHITPSHSPTIGTPKPVIKGQIEEGVIDLIQGQSCQTEFVKSAATESEANRTHNNSRLKSFSCNVCHKIFLSYWKLLQHRLSHKLQTDGTDDLEEFPVDMDASNFKTIFQSSNLSYASVSENKSDDLCQAEKHSLPIVDGDTVSNAENICAVSCLNTSMNVNCENFPPSDPIPSQVHNYTGASTTPATLRSEIPVMGADVSEVPFSSTVLITEAESLPICDSIPLVDGISQSITLTEIIDTSNFRPTAKCEVHSSEVKVLDPENTDVAKPQIISGITTAGDVKPEVKCSVSEVMPTVGLESDPQINLSNTELAREASTCASSSSTVTASTPLFVITATVMLDIEPAQPGCSVDGEDKKPTRTSKMTGKSSSTVCLKPATKNKEFLKRKVFQSKDKKTLVSGAGLPSHLPLTAKTTKPASKTLLKPKKSKNLSPPSVTRSISAKMKQDYPTAAKPKGRPPKKAKELANLDLTCSVCGKIFDAKINRDRHFRMAHKGKTNVLQKEVFQTVRSTTRKPVVSSPEIKPGRGRKRKVAEEVTTPDKKLRSPVQKKAKVKCRTSPR